MASPKQLRVNRRTLILGIPVIAALGVAVRNALQNAHHVELHHVELRRERLANYSVVYESYLDIYESIVRFVLERRAKKKRDADTSSLYLRIHGSDPPPGFLDRFAAGRAILPFSLHETWMGVIELNISRWDNSHAIVVGEHHGLDSQTTVRYDLALLEGKWKVQKSDVTRLSCG